MENFIVSARKYRPATFASVVGQKHITSTLKNAIERGQLAHAYLFCGPRGVGKTTCARIFAKGDQLPASRRGRGMQRLRVVPLVQRESFAQHPRTGRRVEQLGGRHPQPDRTGTHPAAGRRYSVFIIDEVHMLSAAAFNAFLKTLEEPPAHAVFILATTEKHKILPTILSRCQIYDFNRIKVEDSVEYLKYIAGQEGVGYDEESLNLIAQKADGGMRDALSMFDKAVSFCGARLEYKSSSRRSTCWTTTPISTSPTCCSAATTSRRCGCSTRCSPKDSPARPSWPVWRSTCATCSWRAMPLRCRSSN